MIWLSWRQQRAETLIIAGLLAILAAAFIPAGIHIANLFVQEGIGRCVGKDTAACHEAMSTFGSRAGFLGFGFSGWFNLLPGLVGVALAVPLVSDLENGTIRFAWTQSVTRRRWVATKLGIALATALAAGLAVTLLFTWYRTPLDSAFGRLDSSAYDFEGTVPLAYFLFALALALAVGVVWRRIAPAMVVAFAAYVGPRVFFDSWVRPRLLTPLTATWGFGKPGPRLDHALIIFEGPSDKAGHVFSGNSAVLETCSKGTHKGQAFDPHCLIAHGAGFNHAVWQPASRFWEFQGIETALFGGVALLLIAFATWRVLRLD
jgi:hypothetical protein